MIIGAFNEAPMWVVAADNYTIQYDVTYGQREARGMLSDVNSFRTSDTWEWNEADTEKTAVTGRTALIYDYGLEKAAMKRAAEIALYYSHTRPDGNKCFTAYGFSYGAAGENIAAGYTSASAVFEGWKEENENYSGQGHRRNMLSEGFSYIGIGHVTCGDYEYWVQEFSGNPSGASETTADESTTTATSTLKSEYFSKASITLDPSSISLKKGGETSLPTVTTRVHTNDSWHASLGTPVKVSSNASWSSSDTSVASISGSKVAGKAAGSATLTATLRAFDTELAGTCKVKVTDSTSSKNDDSGSATANATTSENAAEEQANLLAKEELQDSSVTLKSVTGKGTKIKVKFKKLGISGVKYQIAYTTGKKTKKVKTSGTAKTIKNLKKGKTYTIKIRAYKKIGGENVYSGWAKKKKVKL